jgi:hypothetical protein
MLAPLSYFGMNNKLGYVRITCTGPDIELTECMNILENALFRARVFKINDYIQKIIVLNCNVSGSSSDQRHLQYTNSTKEVSAFLLKESIQHIHQFLLERRKELYIASHKKSPEEVILSFLMNVKNIYQEEKKLSAMWCRFVDASSDNALTRHKLLSFSKEEIKSFKLFNMWQKRGGEIWSESISTPNIKC